jgi:hypothetical protein
LRGRRRRRRGGRRVKLIGGVELYTQQMLTTVADWIQEGKEGKHELLVFMKLISEQLRKSHGANNVTSS